MVMVLYLVLLLESAVVAVGYVGNLRQLQVGRLMVEIGKHHGDDFRSTGYRVVRIDDVDFGIRDFHAVVVESEKVFLVKISFVF